MECDSFSNTVLVELYDNIGTSFLYCSAIEQNPGPLTSNTVVNDTAGINIRTCVVSLTNTNSRVSYKVLVFHAWYIQQYYWCIIVFVVLIVLEFDKACLLHYSTCNCIESA